MTREEAINIISQMIKDEEGFLSDNTVEAHKMAVKALKLEPCNDAISKQAVLEYIHRILNQGTGKKKSFEFIQKYVEKLPLVNPQPKTGHWIDDMGLGYHVSICSNCNWRGHGDTCLIYKPKYCPNCGAKMVEPQERSGEE